MQPKKTEKKQSGVRFDNHHVRLHKGESQRKDGKYMYRWTDKFGKRQTVYAATLDDLRQLEEQIDIYREKDKNQELLIEKLNCALELLAEELSMVKAEKEEVHKEK